MDRLELGVLVLLAKLLGTVIVIITNKIIIHNRNSCSTSTSTSTSNIVLVLTVMVIAVIVVVAVPRPSSGPPSSGCRGCRSPSFLVMSVYVWLSKLVTCYRAVVLSTCVLFWSISFTLRDGFLFATRKVPTAYNQSTVSYYKY